MKLTRNEVIDRLRQAMLNAYRERDRQKQNSFSERVKGSLWGLEYALGLLNRTYPMIEDHKTWSEEIKLEDWTKQAIPFLRSELWRISDCLAFSSVPTGLGEALDAEIDKKLEEDHAILTQLLKEVGALEE